MLGSFPKLLETNVIELLSQCTKAMFGSFLKFLETNMIELFSQSMKANFMIVSEVFINQYV